jgi:hypothetical protein
LEADVLDSMLHVYKEQHLSPAGVIFSSSLETAVASSNTTDGT